VQRSRATTQAWGVKRNCSGCSIKSAKKTNFPRDPAFPKACPSMRACKVFGPIRTKMFHVKLDLYSGGDFGVVS
jgi:hypothetical protein